jgi:hypothetical protein
MMSGADRYLSAYRFWPAVIGTTLADGSPFKYAPPRLHEFPPLLERGDLRPRGTACAEGY